MSAPGRHGGCAIALVGPDGAGKTTVARALCEALPNSRYLYMGTATDSANYSLPSSRLIALVKRLRSRRSGTPGTGHKALLPESKRRGVAATAAIGMLRALALGNRLAEEWYRQLVLWSFKARGLIVVCDRHFQFEHLPHSQSFNAGYKPISDRVHLWSLRRCYPRPDMIFFLDAAPEILYRRKREWTLQHLERHRNGIIEEGRAYRRFVRVDATAPLHTVVDEVRARVLDARATGKPVSSVSPQVPDSSNRCASPAKPYRDPNG